MLPALRPVAEGGLVPGRGPIRGRALIPYLESRGIELRMHVGRLVVSAPDGRLMLGLREVVEIAERLLVGYIDNDPLPCELPHDEAAPEAWSVALGGLLMCERHANGELQ